MCLLCGTCAAAKQALAVHAGWKLAALLLINCSQGQVALTRLAPAQPGTQDVT